jgi:hypothetical protein
MFLLKDERHDLPDGDDRLSPTRLDRVTGLRGLRKPLRAAHKNTACAMTQCAFGKAHVRRKAKPHRFC